MSSCDKTPDDYTSILRVWTFSCYGCYIDPVLYMYMYKHPYLYYLVQWLL